MNELGARVRLVKGAYKEPPAVAFQQKAEVDAAFVGLMRLLLDDGTYPAIATHDEAILADTRDYRRGTEHRRDRFEFQMLYGIRRDLQHLAGRRRLPDAHLRPLWAAVVSLFHAPSGRTAGQCRASFCAQLERER